MGIELSGIDYQKLILRRDRFHGRLSEMFTRVDMLAIPALAFLVPMIDALEMLLSARQIVARDEFSARRAQWKEAYRSTPHGQPVVLKP